MRQLREVALDLLFPPSCAGCGARGAFLCASCTAALPPLKLPLCARCGKTISSGILCSECAGRSLPIDGMRSVLRFEGVARQAVLQFKYKGVKALAVPLAELLGEYLRAHPLPADVLVPVPLHPRRLRERGYNQSALLARELSRIASLRVTERTLVQIGRASCRERV